MLFEWLEWVESVLLPSALGMELVTLDLAASAVDAKPNATFGSRTLTAFDLESSEPITKFVFVARGSDVPLTFVPDEVTLV